MSKFHVTRTWSRDPSTTHMAIPEELSYGFGSSEREALLKLVGLYESRIKEIYQYLQDRGHNV